MDRRAFLAAASVAALGRAVRAADPPKDVRITRAVGFDLVCKRSKVAGKNARLDVHGDTVREWIRSGRLKAMNLGTPSRPFYRVKECDLLDLTNQSKGPVP